MFRILHQLLAEELKPKEILYFIDMAADGSAPQTSSKRNHLFRAVPERDVIFGYLDEVCHRDNELFVVDDIAYKRMRYDDRIVRLYEYLRPFYHISKQKYLDEDCSRNSFLTVLRQLCKQYHIQFRSKVIYRNGSYDSTLVIYLDRNSWSEKAESSITFTTPS